MKVLLLTFVAGITALVLLGHLLDYASLVAPVVVCGMTWLISYCCSQRGWKRAAEALSAFSMFLAASMTVLLLTYGLGTLDRLYVDGNLASMDARLGLSASRTIQWTNDHSLVHTILSLVYDSMVFQSMLVVCCLRHPHLFVKRYTLGVLITALFFAFWPAQGSCAHFGLPTPTYYTQVLHDLSALRCGHAIDWQTVTGIVTFPSFHAIWAVLLIAAFWPTRLRWLATTLNGLVILSVVPIGMHYYTDLVVGIAIAAIALALTRGRVEYQRDTQPGDASCPTLKTGNSSKNNSATIPSSWLEAANTGS